MPDPYTTAIHGDADVSDAPGLGPPIHVASTYDRSAQDELVYRRDEHQTTSRLEAVISALEGGTAVAYPSGMAATAAVLRHIRPRRVALPEDVYHGTKKYIATDRFIEETGRIDLQAGDVLWLETPSNPRCRVADIGAAVAEAADNGVAVIVDSTFATPILQHPIALGANFVIHSTTKFIGGHSDAMGGVVVAATRRDAEELLLARSRDGSIPGSLDIWLTLRGVRTLPLRILRQSETALGVATYLQTVVPVVWYPFLAGHPGEDVARRQMAAGGGVVSFEVEGDERAKAIVAGLRLIRRATSLGGVETSAEHRRSVDPAAPPGLVRVSIGLESAADLIADLDQAIDA